MENSEQGRKRRWGILSAGKIAADFVLALKSLPEEAEVVAVGARKLSAAEAFVKALALPRTRCYEGYEGVIEDPEVDVIYVATLPDTHVSLASLCLERRKAVLVEKPIGVSAAQALELVNKARKAKVFLMEGMWTRCFPAVRKARELLDAGEIGEVVAVAADFGFYADPNPAGENARLFEAEGGGVALDIGEYPVGHCLIASGSTAPSRIVALGQAEGPETDWAIGATFDGFENRPQLLASVFVTLRASTVEEAVFTGTKGTLRIHRPAHAPTKLTLTRMAADRSSSADVVYDFPLPKLEGSISVNYPNSEGLLYEAQAVHRALESGRTEAEEWTHQESVTAMTIVDAMRASVKTGQASLIVVPKLEA